ncbi:MAG: diguanylate cyclase [Pseudomonadaceae bacterium]|nr:diguanylate cyclase [Pseudomonadaceae bacterium]
MEIFGSYFHGRPKLLVVDDQALNIRVLHELFRFECDVHMTTSGEQVLAMCRELMPDLILLDVVMDGLDGHQVCQQLKADPKTRDIPVIFITGKSDENDEATGLELGAVDYISKPFNPVVVRARVRTHLTLKLQSDYLRAQVMLDGLTGIPNRRAFDERLEAAWGQSCRDGSPLSLLMIDVDHFKHYNDHYGHLQGDQCLRQVARALAGVLNRPYDLLARFGGEEFVGLLPDTDEAGAVQIAERMRAAIAGLDIEHAAAPGSGRLGVSIGVATALPTPLSSAAEHLGWADEQLYRAKREGRDRVCSRFYGG